MVVKRRFRVSGRGLGRPQYFKGPAVSLSLLRIHQFRLRTRHPNEPLLPGPQVRHHIIHHLLLFVIRVRRRVINRNANRFPFDLDRVQLLDFLFDKPGLVRGPDKRGALPVVPFGTDPVVQKIVGLVHNRAVKQLLVNTGQPVMFLLEPINGARQTQSQCLRGNDRTALPLGRFPHMLERGEP